MISLVNQLSQADTAAPVVLNYHNITARPTSKRYDVTAELFAQHMELLHQAGFRSITPDQYTQFLAGDANLGPRTFLLTFDDGASGVLRHADPVLQRYGFQGLVFLITGNVGKHQPYYLTWTQIGSMHSSGRWFFGSHTHGLHHRVATETHGSRSAFTHREVTATGQPESLAAFEHKLQQDIDQVANAFDRHQVPRVPFFAWPFSNVARAAHDSRTSTVRDHEAGQAALRIVNDHYAVSFTNAEHPRMGLRELANSGPMERLEIRGDHDLAGFAHRMAQALAKPDAEYTLGQPDSTWTTGYKSVAGPENDPQHGLVAPQHLAGRYHKMEWNLASTSHWQAAELHTTLGGQLTPAGSSAGIRCYVQTDVEHVVLGRSSSIVVMRREGRTFRRVASRRITHAAQVRVTWQADRMRVWVNDGLLYDHDVPPPIGRGVGVFFDTGQHGGVRPRIGATTITAVEPSGH